MIDTRADEDDPALVRLVDASLPFRTASRAGDHLVAAWRSSVPARAGATWLAVPLDRRVRLLSVVVVVAVLTHVALTRFSAPEPTWWARGAWVAVVLLAAAAGVGSRGLAAAWATRAERRNSPDV